VPVRPVSSRLRHWRIVAVCLGVHTGATWGLVVPVKRLTLAKTRLQEYGDTTRQELALAFAADVVRAALRCPLVAGVLVVTDDRRAAAVLSRLGAGVVPDDPGAGLNPALAHGADLVRARDPDCAVATLSADLPALTEHDLAAALGTVRAGERAFVADVSDGGTTLLAAGPGARLDPAYGPGSRQRHAASGARELAGPPSLRLDVDTPADLDAARTLGVGPATAAVLAGLA